MQHLVRAGPGSDQVVDERLARLIDIDPAEVSRRLDAEPGDLSDLLEVADRVATVDSAFSTFERAIFRTSRSLSPSVTPSVMRRPRHRHRHS